MLSSSFQICILAQSTQYSFMRQIALIFILIITLQSCSSEFDKNAEVQAIAQVLYSQQDAWNEGDLDHFMDGYWNSDSLEFVSGKWVRKGWGRTLKSYKKHYPNREKMGQLSFTFDKIDVLTPQDAVVTGAFRLQFEKAGAKDARGQFTLIWKKIDGKWLIIRDHTSG